MEKEFEGRVNQKMIVATISKMYFHLELFDGEILKDAFNRPEDEEEED